MVGFFKRLLSTPEDGNEPGEEMASPPAPQPKAEAFFLGADDAKTLGNIEYMRTPRKVKRTFAQNESSKAEGEAVFVQEVSALGRKVTEGRPADAFSASKPAKATPKEVPATSQSTTDKDTSDRRKADDSLDMFRSMARDIRK